jgi:hypothetical protein
VLQQCEIVYPNIKTAQQINDFKDKISKFAED